MAIHFNKKTVVVILVIMAMIFFNRRYYFYCIDNAYYEYSVDNKLEYYYGDYKFGHLGKKVNVFKEDDLYRFEYIASMSDGDIQFDVIKNMYDTKRLGGHSYRDDYWGARDNYLRKKLEKQGIDLGPYEVDFREAAACDEPDCRFVLSEGDNEKEIVVIT